VWLFAIGLKIDHIWFFFSSCFSFSRSIPVSMLGSGGSNRGPGTRSRARGHADSDEEGHRASGEGHRASGIPSQGIPLARCPHNTDPDF
jgi:hypothetical protein